MEGERDALFYNEKFAITYILTKSNLKKLQFYLKIYSYYSE